MALSGPSMNRGVRTRIFANVTLVSVLAVVLVAFLNVGISEWSEGRDVRLDLTATQWQSFTPETVSLLEGIEDEIDEVAAVRGYQFRLWVDCVQLSC